ncbi:MAG: F510_1955 family glycosylhydrolase [Micromonosporaceae bacterium]
MIAAVAAVVLFSVWSATRDASPEHGAGGEITHIHGLGINPADRALYVAAHNGVFRLDARGKAQRVGDGKQDTMGFTIVGADHFLASGHSAPDSGGPAHLGLIESTDGGKTWSSLSMQDQADFHALRYRHDTVYGYNSLSGQLLASEDRTTWQTRSEVQLRDFAVSPTDPNTLVATGAGGPMRSTDGGRNWTGAGGDPIAVLDWETDERLWGVTADGRVMRSTDGGVTWSGLGEIGGQPAAFAAGPGKLYVATPEGRIAESSDDGRTWATRYP